MKYSFYVLLFLCLLTSCEKETEAITPQCEILGQEIVDLIQTEGLTDTRLEASGIVNLIGTSGVPTVDGCILEYRNTFYNLQHLVSYEANGTMLVLNFL